LNKAIFLDRDGTIIKAGDHNYKIEDIKFVDSAIDGLGRMKNLGFKLIITTNQAGIAKGFYEEKDYLVFREELHKRLSKYGIFLDAEYFCPHHVDGTVERYKIDCNCRKPKTGMLEQAAKDFNLNLSACWLIGDMPSDIDAGKNAGCKTIQVMTGETRKEYEKADFFARDLWGASYLIS
jgi:D,D-heptose 1,7-bisphosphate phosphatase